MKTASYESESYTDLFFVMMEKQARSKWLIRLVYVLNITAVVTLYLICEDISLEWVVVFMLLWMGVILIMNYEMKKNFIVRLEEPIAAIVAELRGGSYSRKKSFLGSTLISLYLIVLGFWNSTNHLNNRVFLLSMGVFGLFLGIFELLSSKKRPQIRLVLLEDKLLLFEAPNKEETIPMEDFRYCVFEEKKIYVLSECKDTATIDSRNFEEEEFTEFKARLQSVTDYWLKKKEQQLA
ncbi:hypothetical protein [Lewinella sp. LCG006]|uniref:hypothetical protein n=1 Tax=Lewinella sp. LCG006 TaxID=3231911 RepID=UPI003460F47D